jgi:hypothetical protein
MVGLYSSVFSNLRTLEWLCPSWPSCAKDEPWKHSDDAPSTRTLHQSWTRFVSVRIVGCLLKTILGNPHVFNLTILADFRWVARRFGEFSMRLLLIRADRRETSAFRPGLLPLLNRIRGFDKFYFDMDSASITVDNGASPKPSPPNSVHAVVPWIHIPHSPVEVCCRMQGLASGYWLFKLSCARTVFWV